MTTPPMPFVWSGSAFVPCQGFARRAAEAYGAGEIVPLVEWRDRSDATHKHEFAWLREAWSNLPDDLARQFQTPEHLRKRALIETGFCTTRDYVCGSQAEAVRWAENLRHEADEYAVIIVSKAVVRIHTAKSQSRRHMGAEEFQASKTAILDWCARLLDVAAADLAHAA